MVTGVHQTVLIVEDEDVILRMLARVVERVQGVAYLATDVASGRQMLAEREYSCILLDKNLPDGTGLELLAEAKQRYPETDVLLVTAFANVDSAVEALRLGATDYIVKPFAPTIVEHRLRQAFDRRRLKDEAQHMERMLLQSDRMATLGTLAAGVAHEINNPLSYVTLNLDALGSDTARLRKLALGAPPELRAELELRIAAVEKKLKTIQKGADRVTAIVRDLRRYSHGNDEQKGKVDLLKVLESSLQMAGATIRRKAEVARSFGPIPQVEGSELRLEQVFLNLLINAAQSIDEKARGQITVRTFTDELGCANVEVEDSGAGIPPEVMARLFDPFFTTKPIGEGTGLGLSICQSIVSELGGEITAKSEPGRGSAFRVQLPAYGTPKTERPAPPAAGIVARKGKILVVDDEPLVGEMLTDALAGEHDVVAVTRAANALQQIAAGQHFDVILCDLLMPEMTGMELHDQLVARSPRYAEKMLFLTGAASTPRARAFLDKVRNPRLEKPFQLQDLREMIATLLPAA